MVIINAHMSSVVVKRAFVLSQIVSETRRGAVNYAEMQKELP